MKKPKIKALKGTITTQRMSWAWTLLWDKSTGEDLTEVLPFENIVKTYGNLTVERLYPFFDEKSGRAILVIDVDTSGDSNDHA